MLHSLVKQIGASAQFEFVPIPECTRAQFLKYWSDPNTYGLFWLGHGTSSGLPATNEVRAGHLTATLNPILLEQSSKNLMFIALLSCFSGTYRGEWINKLGSVHTQIKTFESTLEGGTGPLRAEIQSARIENKIDPAGPDKRSARPSAIRSEAFDLGRPGQDASCAYLPIILMPIIFM